MAVVRIPAEERTLRDAAEVARALATIGIDFSRVEIPADVTAAPADRVLAAYEREIAALKERGGYVTADVIDVRPDTPGLDAMLAKFSREHWHDEDEVRLIVSGRGIFHIRPKDGPVHAIEVGAGDSIRVPAGTLHWFDLCEAREIRAIRLFQDPCGWTPRYTESGAETGYQPVCLGPAYVRA
ncbi:MAG TPA: cupin domain-containing protein [Thermoanaerobaculia bacterium]|nr:cupin domain-containing protein [Thermoanaerobaculia bacterium]